MAPRQISQPDVTGRGQIKQIECKEETTKPRSCSPYHVSKGGNEEEEDGEDAHQCAVCTRLHYILGYCLQGSWEDLEQTERGGDQIRER